MQNLTRRALALAGAAMLLTMTAVWAQAPGTRIRGQIEKADGSMLSVKLRDGGMLNVKVADDARVSALTKASLADIKNDTFIGVAGMPQPDGSIKAFSVHIFLPAQRGVVPDRHGPWDAKPGSTMTNAYVTTAVKEKDGEVLTVKYKDGEKKVVVPPDTPVVTFVAGDKSELKPGAKIIIFGAVKKDDGTLEAARVNVGRDGITPPM